MTRQITKRTYTEGNDRIRQNYVADYIFELLGGDDWFSGAIDRSVIRAGAGNDWIYFQGAKNLILLGSGNDYVQLWAGGGNQFYLESGDDAATINGHTNTIDGAAGNDRIDVKGSQNYISASVGNDRLKLEGSNNQVLMGDGNDYAELWVGVNQNNTIRLGSGNDIIAISGNRNTIDGESGNDTIKVLGFENTIYIGGHVSDRVGVYGDRNIIVDNPFSGRRSQIEIQGNNNSVQNSYYNMIDVHHGGASGWNTANIQGVANDITINTKDMKQSPGGQFSQSLSVNVNGQQNIIKATMEEGRQAYVTAADTNGTITLDFGTAGSDNFFDQFAFGLEVYRNSTVRLNIKAPFATLTRIKNFPNDPTHTYVLNAENISQPNGKINLTRIEGNLSLVLNGNLVFSYSQN